MWSRLKAIPASLSFPGMVFGALFFAASLTPSLLPRTYVLQGVLSGVALTGGYAVGALLANIWLFFQLPRPKPDIVRIPKILLGFFCVAVLAAAMWSSTGWQNSIHERMNLPPLASANPVYVAVIALLVFAALLLLTRLFKWLRDYIRSKFRMVAPPRIAYLAGALCALALFWTATEGVLFRGLLRAADSSYRAMDELMDAGDAPKANGQFDASLSPVSWTDLGRQGRAFLDGAATAAEITTFQGTEAKQPIRVYVGLKAADTSEARAKLALQELVRRGGFDRSTLVVITPTGTGWVDPEAVDPLEYLTGGDVATVAVQYSYLASWLSLFVEPDYGSKTSRALFHEVYRYWTALPHDKRPKLYLFGLSLGAYSTEKSSELFEVIGDPYQGVLLAGPPFPSRIWRSMTDMRNAGTPEWLPQVGDGSYVRFTSQTNSLNQPGAQWGPMRTVYLQYASDPIVFFEPSSFYRRPQWLSGERGPDVSPELRWYPGVTFLQLLVDVIRAASTPKGYGHVYAARDYIDAWREVLALDLPQAGIDRLKQRFVGR